MHDDGLARLGYSVLLGAWRFSVCSFLLLLPRDASASPETWIEPYLSIEGTVADSRFGDSLACSSVSVTGGNRSIFAIGAPDEKNGQGAVYLHDPENPSQPLQRITAPTPQDGRRFGAAVAFVNDINGDGADDLVVGEPSGSSGSIYVFGSDISSGSPRFSFCALSSHESSLGSRLLALQGMGVGGETLISSAPLSGSTYSFDISRACSGSIQVGLSYTRLNEGGELGTALGEAPSAFLSAVATPGAPIGGSAVLAGQPSFSGSEGRVALLQGASSSSLFRYDEAGYGASIASSSLSTVMAIGSPERRNQIGGVDVVSASGELLCSIAPDPHASGLRFGASVAHLEGSFSRLTGGETQFFAFRPEASTGGSLSLFGYQPGTSSCSAGIQVNNCEDDPAQEQGKAVVGGPRCRVRRNGAARAAVLFSSPGWQGERGRVDIIIEGSERSSPVSCSRPGAVAPAETPIPAEPGDTSLPPADVSVSGGNVSVHMPLLAPSVTGANYERALRMLQRRGLSRQQARKALRSLEVTYIVSIRSGLGANGKAAAVSSKTISVSARSWAYRRKRNQISFNNLKPGSYSLTWRAEFSTKRPPVVIGSAGSRTVTRFTIGGR